MNEIRDIAEEPLNEYGDIEGAPYMENMKKLRDYEQQFMLAAFMNDERLKDIFTVTVLEDHGNAPCILVSDKLQLVKKFHIMQKYFDQIEEFNWVTTKGWR
jgi:hypothetical protein